MKMSKWMDELKGFFPKDVLVREVREDKDFLLYEWKSLDTSNTYGYAGVIIKSEKFTLVMKIKGSDIISPRNIYMRKVFYKREEGESAWTNGCEISKLDYKYQKILQEWFLPYFI